MARYIDADKALKRIKELQETDPATVGKKQFAEGFFCGLDEAEVVLLQAPTADVVEVVRCKDCLRRDKSLRNSNGKEICPKTDMEVKDNTFCSYGERKQ